MDFAGMKYTQRGGETAEEKAASEDGIAQKYPGWLFIVIYVLMTIAFGLIILLFTKISGIQESLVKIGGDVKSSTGIFTTLKEALSKFGGK